MKKYHLFLLIIIAVFTWTSCQKDLDFVNLSLDTTPENYQEKIFFHDLQDPSFKYKMHLGRVLFYDTKLSVNDKVSCGSCHDQKAAFSDPFKHSIGIGAQLSERNTPSIVNSAFSSGLFWDQRTSSLSDLVLQPVLNHKEMGFTHLADLSNKLSQVDYYKELFKNAYGSEVASVEAISDALRVFCEQLTSFDSDFDHAELTPSQKAGAQLFVDKGCNSCHQVMNEFVNINANGFAPRVEPGFATGGYTGSGKLGEVANIGLDRVYEDNGVSLLSGTKSDDGKFKIPTLRNINLTAPYMHDGRFQTLKEVLDFYDDGIASHRNLDHRLSPKGLDLSEADKWAIIDFLGSLQSKDVISNPHYSNPFKQ